MRKKLLWLALAGVVSAVTVVWLTTATPAGAAPAASQVPRAGTGSPQTGDFTPSSGDVTEDEFPSGEESDEGPDPYNGTISRSSGTGGGPSVASGKKAKSNPKFNFGFEGLNHYQQRYSRGGNQFSVEPPDQGMCVGNGYVVEVVNDVFNVFSAATGASLLPDNTATNIVGGFPRNVNHAVDLNSFYGYAPAINRKPRPIPGRLSAHRGRRQRLLHHDKRVSVVLQRLQRRADLRALEGAVGRRRRERERGALRHLRDGERVE